SPRTTDLSVRTPAPLGRGRPGIPGTRTRSGRRIATVFRRNAHVQPVRIAHGSPAPPDRPAEGGVRGSLRPRPRRSRPVQPLHRAGPGQPDADPGGTAP